MPVCSPMLFLEFIVLVAHIPLTIASLFGHCSLHGITLINQSQKSQVGKAPPIVFVDIILEIGDMPLARSFVEESFLFSFEDAKYHNGRQCHS